MLETVLQYGTGKAAAIGQFAAGKTGTTSNYGDAWFVGWDSKYTVAVWVGYPNKLIPMTTDFDGGPVLGGTFPALIWHDFMTSALQIDKERAEHAAAEQEHGRRARAAAKLDGSDSRRHGADGLEHAVRHRLRRRTSTAEGRRSPRRHHERRRRSADARARRGSRTRGAATAHACTGAGDPGPAPTPPRASAAATDAGGVAPSADRRRQPGRLARACRRRGAAAGARRWGCRPRRSARAARPPWLMPDARARERRAASRQSCGARADPHRAARQELPLSASSMPSACVSLPGPEQSSRSRVARARRERRGARASLEPAERLERPDQHRRADALRLADRVQHRVDAVGAVHVGATGRAEQRCCVRGVSPTNAWHAGSLSW